MNTIRLKIDLSGGVIEIESDKDSFEKVSDKAASLLEKFQKAETIYESAVSQETNENSNNQTNPIDDFESPPKPKRKKSVGSSKIANWKMIDDFLDESKRIELKKFYNEKSPKNQNEQVAVLSVKLAELTKREAFDGNEIHTAFQIVGKKTPGNLTAVFGNMTGAGLGSQAGKKFKPNFKAGDLVKHDLPKKKENN